MPGMYQYNGKLHTSLRFSEHLDLQSLQNKIFVWVGRNSSSFAIIDRVHTALVYTMVFFIVFIQISTIENTLKQVLKSVSKICIFVMM